MQIIKNFKFKQSVIINYEEKLSSILVNVLPNHHSNTAAGLDHLKQVQSSSCWHRCLLTQFDPTLTLPPLSSYFWIEFTSLSASFCWIKCKKQKKRNAEFLDQFGSFQPFKTSRYQNLNLNLLYFFYHKRNLVDLNECPENSAQVKQLRTKHPDQWHFSKFVPN